MAETRELNLTLDFCLRVGELLLSSGAGAADVTATLHSLAYGLDMRHADIDITFTSLSMSHQPSPEDPPLLQVRQVKQRSIDYSHLTEVDHLIRDVANGDADLREARSRLARITSTGHIRARWRVTLAWGVMCGGIGLMLGGDLAVVGVAALSAVVIDLTQQQMSKRRVPSFYQQIAGGGIATLLAVALSSTPLTVNPSLVVTANIIMLLAGIGFMGALQDAITGFYITAGARLTEAILATSGIIAGVSGGLSVAAVIGLDTPTLNPGTTDLGAIGVIALGAGIGAGSFAYASHAPGRIVLPIGVIGALAMGISQALAAPGVGRTWSVAFAALFVGLVSFAVAGRLRVPPLVVVVSAVVPMLPGISIFRGLTLLAEDSGTSEGLLAMVTSASVAIALSAGVILGEYLAQPVRREAQRLESRLAGPRLVGPLRPRTKRSRARAEGTAQRSRRDTASSQ